MITLDINFKELNQLKAGMFKDVDNAVLRALNEGGRDFVAAVRMLTPVGASGNLKSGVHHRVIGQFLARTLIIDVKGPAKKYAQYREEGRRPGRMPPPDAIRRWLVGTARGKRFVAAIKRAYKIKSQETALRSATFLKARAIGEQGYPAAKMFEKSLKRMLPKIEKMLDRTVRAALKKYQK